MKLAKVKFNISTSKSGRSLLQTDLEEVESLVGIELRKPYFVTIDPGSVAGNHYHVEKREAFMVVSGEATVKLVNPDTEEVAMQYLQNDGTTLVVPKRYAHAVKNPSEKTPLILMVWASHPAREAGDDYEYDVGLR